MKNYTSVAVDDADEDHGLPSDPLPGFKKPTASNNADDSDVLPKPIKTSFQEKLAEKGPDSPDTAESAADKKKLLKRQADACFSKVMLCTIAISLVWMSSLGVARFIVQSAIASPPFSVVSFECMRGWDKMVSEKEGHTACTSVQAKSTPPARARRNTPLQVVRGASQVGGGPALARFHSLPPPLAADVPVRCRARGRRRGRGCAFDGGERPGTGCPEGLTEHRARHASQAGGWTLSGPRDRGSLGGQAGSARWLSRQLHLLVWRHRRRSTRCCTAWRR